MVGANNDWAIYDGAQFLQIDGLGTAMPGNPVPTGNPVWALISQQTVTVGPTAPAGPQVGHQWFDNTSGTLFTWDGTLWRPPSVGVPLGTIISHASVNPPAGYLLCNGTAIPAGAQYDPLRQLIGANTPDLNGYFLRGNTSQANIDGWIKRQDTTRRPRTPFSGTTASAGSHHHEVNTRHNSGSGDWDYLGGYESGSNYRINVDPSGWHNGNVKDAGTHSHNFSVTGGGDAETAPKSVYCAYHIRAIA